MNSLDFAFEGFRIIRSKPHVVLAWGLLLLIGNSLALYALTSMAGPALQSLQHLQAQSPAAVDQAAVMALMPPILSAYAIALPILVITDSLAACAVYRAVLGREDGKFAYLGLGMAEVRQIVAGILFLLIILALMLACLICVSVVAGILAAVTGVSSAALGYLSGFIAMAFVAVFVLRLSFFGVQTFDEGRINLFGSWRITRGRAWRLATGYLIAGIMVMLVYLLCFAIFAAFAVGFNGGDIKVLDPILNGDTVNMAMFRSPVMIAYLVVANGLVGPLTLAISAGAPAAAYLSLRGEPVPARTENVF